MPSPESVTRRNLPHWYVPGAAHFVTYRLAGTIPASVMRQWRSERESHIQGDHSADVNRVDFKARAHKRFFAQYDRYLDSHSDIAWLANREVAAVIRENLYRHHGTKYHLLAYCVMPNHVHVLLQPIDEHRSGKQPFLSPHGQNCASNVVSDELPDRLSPLARIMHSLKSYTANRCNQELGRLGQFWQHESYDHWVRDDEELGRILEYIRFNPVSANLVSLPQEWIFSSAYDRFLLDGVESALLVNHRN